MEMRKTKQSRWGEGMGPQKPARDMSATAQRALRKILLVVLPSDGDACSFLCSREITTIDQRIFKHKEKESILLFFGLPIKIQNLFRRI